MTQLCAYLSYNGNCAEAMAFYARVLDAKVEALITYAQMPDGDPVPPEHADRIMHAHLVHPDFALMAGDTPPGVPFEGIKGAMLALTYPSAAEARRIFGEFMAIAACIMCLLFIVVDIGQPTRMLNVILHATPTPSCSGT